MNLNQLDALVFFASAVGILICFIINICLKKEKKTQNIFLFSSLFGIIIVHFYMKWNLAVILIFKIILYLFVFAGNVIYLCCALGNKRGR